MGVIVRNFEKNPKRYENNIIVQSQKKIHYPPQGSSSEIPRGRGVLKGKILEAKYEAELEFPEVRGVQNKNLPWGE